MRTRLKSCPKRGEEVLCRGIERPSRPGDRLAHVGGRRAGKTGGPGALRAHLAVFLAGGAFAAYPRRRRAGDPHHLVGDAVRLVFERIVGCADL
jgi:hypothetical protein